MIVKQIIVLIIDTMLKKEHFKIGTVVCSTISVICNY